MKRVVAVVLILSAAVGLAVATPASAGDGSSIMYSEESSYTAAPGEAVTVVIVVSDHGSLTGDGLEHVSLVADYDPDALQATDVEANGWFESGDESVTVATDTDIDADAGVVTLTQTREPAGDGTVATAPFATITFTVDEDATGNTTVGLEESSVTLAGGYAKALFVQPTQDGPNGPQIQVVDGADRVPGLTAVTAVIALVLAAAVAVRRKNR